MPIPDLPIFIRSSTSVPLNGRLRLGRGFSPGTFPNSCYQDSRSRDSRFPEMGDLATRGLRRSDGSDYIGVFTWDFPEFLLPGLPISRFPISRNGRSRDTWPPSFGRLGLYRGFHLGLSRILVTRTPDLAIPDFPKWEISRHVASVVRTAQIYPGGFRPCTLGT
jgi:hypothetical protein